MADLHSEFVTIKDAAVILGISANTLRNWGASHKIDEYRHPVNNYRLYKLSDLRKLRTKLKMPRRAK